MLSVRVWHLEVLKSFTEERQREKRICSSLEPKDYSVYFVAKVCEFYSLKIVNLKGLCVKKVC